MSMNDLFANDSGLEILGEGITLWRSAIDVARYVSDIEDLARRAPFRNMQVPRGRTMSVAITNCGKLGWISDTRGYRYSAIDPTRSAPWPAMPEHWLRDAAQAAQRGGFAGFSPDACLVNCYEVGARMGAHQDRDELDFSQPVVSISLGLSAAFAFHGETRSGTRRRIELHSGDVLIWGGPARLHFHSVAPVKAGLHPLCGARRFNLTFRRAGA